MFVFLNGKCVPEEQALVSVFDRSFLYGDGLFETLLIANGTPFRWEQHLRRLEQGASFLGINLPFTGAELKAFAGTLLRENQVTHSLLRLSLSRGIGARGYSPRGANSPTVVMSLHPTRALEQGSQPTWKLKTSSFKLPAGEPLAQFKNCNKLPQILARSEAEAAGVDEALLTNTEGHIIEGAASNLFWVERNAVATPPLFSGILSGITRLVVLELCHSLGIEVRERNINSTDLHNVDGVFLTLSSLGIVAGESLDGKTLRQSPVTTRIGAAYSHLVQSETGG